MRNRLGAGLTRGHDIIRVVRIGHGLAVLLNAAADLREFVLGELFGQDKALPLGGHEGLALLRLIDDGQRRGIVDGSKLLHIGKLMVVHKGQ